MTAPKYFPMLISLGGSMVVCLHEDGTPEYGPGVTAENVWAKIAEALPRPAELDSGQGVGITRATGVQVQ